MASTTSSAFVSCTPLVSAAAATVKAVCARRSSFVLTTTAVTAQPKPAATPAVLAPAPLRMQEGYVIQQSEYIDPDDSEDGDGGDGFMGESDMDDHLGVAMPDDLASFEKREIQNCDTREELVSKLRDIRDRRRDILTDRRKGLGMENANDYLRNL